MREVATVRKVEPEDLVPRLKESGIHRCIGLAAGVRLHVGILRSEESLRPVDSDLLYLVHHFASPVIAGTGIPFGIFVGQDGTHRFEHLVAHVVLGGDQFDAVRLAVAFVLYQVKDQFVSLHGVLFGLSFLFYFSFLFRRIQRFCRKSMYRRVLSSKIAAGSPASAP